MPKILEEGSDSDVEFKTDNAYAKNYDTWRKKEELNRLKTKYGEDSLNLLEDDSSSSSDDDEEGVELTEEVEKQFYKTLSYLKNKDPRIYDKNINFFHDSENSSSNNQKKKKKEKPLYIKDYERELILQKNGELSDSNEEEIEEDPRAKSPTYVEEQKKIKESFKMALDKVTEDDDNEWGGMLKVRQKTKEEKIKEEADYKEWLAGQKDQLEDKETESELKPLKDYWANPNLDEGEKFLRDYILGKKFLSNEDEDYVPTYEEIIHDSDRDLSEDEQAIDKQEEFEHKYNFRFEEPDQEFIKRYPRTMEHSLRKTDDRRKIKRAETKERKQKEKQQKMEELKKLQELKRKEIEDKIQKLKEITGNTDLEFKDEDLDGDFDPEAHDKRMQSLFNDEFYQQPEDDQKPEFPEIDEYLELENWEKWNGEDVQGDEEEYTPHCEDEDFNMDCDYDPQTSVKEELISNSKGKKKRKRKSLFAKVVSQPKPVFDPNDKTYEEYLDEYYKLDCEDIIGDIPCKFKYRKVVPNSFGLSIEEILLAKDRELNKWCSLKKAVQHRPDHVEKYDQIAFEKKAKNIELKRKILPSLFEIEENKSDETKPNDNKKKKTKKIEFEENETKNDIKPSCINENNKKVKKLKKTKPDIDEKKKESTFPKVEIKSEESSDKVQNKKKRTKLEDIDEKKESTIPELENSGEVQKKKKRKKKKILNNNDNQNNNAKVTKKRKLLNDGSKQEDNVTPKKKFKKVKNLKDKNVGISDARLSAYGLNPKKFKNKLKYGKKIVLK